MHFAMNRIGILGKLDFGRCVDNFVGSQRSVPCVYIFIQGYSHRYTIVKWHSTSISFVSFGGQHME